MFAAALATLVFLPSAAVGNQIKLCQIFDEFWFDSICARTQQAEKNNKCGWDTCGSLPLSWRQDIRKDTGARTWAPNPYRTQSHESYEWAQPFCGASRSSHRSILYLFEFIILFLSTRPIVLSPIVCISLTKNRNELGNQGR